MKLIFGLFLITSIQIQNISSEGCCEDYCFQKDTERPQLRHFSTKTSYEFVKGAEHDTQYKVPYCTAEKIWIISRHGTRLPGAKTIRKMKDLGQFRDRIIENYITRKTQPINGALCREDVDLLRNWVFDSNITESYSNYLTVQGWNEIKFLAKFYKRIFQEVLNITYNSEKFLFRHTNYQRTQASFQAFAEGLFGGYSYIKSSPIPENDTLLHPHSNCPLWVQQNDKDDEPNTEFHKFKISDIMNKTISDISTRLGFTYSLDFKEIDIIWDMCRYEQAWYIGRASPWCIAFTQNEVKVLEYAEDLKSYYNEGYGSPINKNIACFAIQDMLKHFETENQPQAIAYFTHSAVINLLLTAMGIAKDTKDLLADNYQEMHTRKWQTSSNTPFASNLVAVKYKCDTNNETNKVSFFLNQNRIDLNWCHVGLCDWSQMLHQYDKFYKADCIEKFCSLNSAQSILIWNMKNYLIVIFSIVIAFRF